MSRRQLNATERKLHKYALERPDKVVNQKELEALVPDAKGRLAAINFLLGTGLFVVLESRGEGLSYRAVSHSEIDLKKGLSHEEGLVLDRIRAAGNEGIWTKHIKIKTQLHQTIVDKCLKSLTQKQLVKTVTDVRHSTRKIYMLYNIEPSVEMTGGPWYTDKELDTEFIKLLSDVCLKIIRDRSLPKARRVDDGRPRQLYPLAHASYPNAEQILGLLNKSQVTETVLTVEHVNMLLDVLVLDGKVEKLPAFNAAVLDDGEDGEEDDGDSSESRSKRSKIGPLKRKRRDGLDDDSDEEDKHQKRRRHTVLRSSARRDQKRRRSRHSDDEDTDTDEDDDSIEDGRARRKRSRRQESSSESHHEYVRKRSKGKGKRRGSSLSSASETELSDDSDASGSSNDSPSIRTARAPWATLADVGGSHFLGGTVYRAVYEERIRGLGLDQDPCVRCPTFDFCQSGGPVNPQECLYYEGWLDVEVGAL
ncbi:RNA polymerase Rpc34 subunit-domain-containing protein [Trametes polyzona]|nr:RNA polymerase Rpc34 subunit-domain-containing protein [Trametes polyzona]